MTLLPDLPDRLKDLIVRHGVPGAAVAIGFDGQLAEAAAGVLNVDTAVESTSDSLFQIGSVTKVFTAALVHQLVDDGLVDLDAPIQSYLPGFRVGEPITTRHLLCHSGGFTGDLFDDTGRGDDALDRYLERVDRAPQVYPPGELFSYCNSGYGVLGALAARLRGGTWESVLRERLLTPLGITHAALFAEEAVLFRTSAGHLEGAVARPWGLPRANAPAGATMCASPRELVRFGQALLGGGGPVLSKESTEALRTKHIDVPGDGVATGWSLGCILFDWGTPVFGHDGDTIGQCAYWRMVPEHGLVIAACANTDAGALFTELATAVAAELAGLRVTPRSTPPATPLIMPLDGLAGRYEGPLAAYEVTADTAGLDVRLVPSGTGLALGMTGRTERFVPLKAPDTFISAEKVGSVHQVIAFVDGGRFLHNSRAIPRADG